MTNAENTRKTRLLLFHFYKLWLHTTTTIIISLHVLLCYIVSLYFGRVCLSATYYYAVGLNFFTFLVWRS
jgi:hypothetical protein